MRRSDFPTALALAALAALLGAGINGALARVIGPADAFVLAVTCVAGAWLAGSLVTAARNGGRVVVALAWCLAAALLLAMSTPPLPLVAAHLALLWLARVLLYHRQPLAGVADFAITSLALVAGTGAYLHSGSFLLGAWSLLLVQTAGTWRTRPASEDTGGDDPEARFTRARVAAEAALARLERAAWRNA
ncbi:MAG: hypothetical protein RLW61_08685 [Gammaproteobacteria bacterium]